MRITIPPCAFSGELAHALEQPLHLVGAGIGGAAGAHEAFRLASVDARHGGGIEIPVRDEHAALGQRDGDRLRAVPLEREDSVAVRGVPGGGP